MNHFARFGMEIHSGPIEPREDSKYVVLFCSKPQCMYADPITFDNVDLSDIIFGDRFIPIVDLRILVASLAVIAQMKQM